MRPDRLIDSADLRSGEAARDCAAARCKRTTQFGGSMEDASNVTIYRRRGGVHPKGMKYANNRRGGIIGIDVRSSARADAANALVCLSDLPNVEFRLGDRSSQSLLRARRQGSPVVI